MKARATVCIASSRPGGTSEHVFRRRRSFQFAPGEAYQFDWSHEYADCCCGRFPAVVALSMATGRYFVSMSATLSAGMPTWAASAFIRAQGLLDLLGGDREIGAGGNPRLDLLAQASLFEFGDGALDAVRFIKIRLDERTMPRRRPRIPCSQPITTSFIKSATPKCCTHRIYGKLPT